MYEIMIAGRLPTDWLAWFEGFEAETAVTSGGVVTTLVGPIADQAALHGVLAGIRDLAISIISVTKVDEPPVGGNTPLDT